MPKFSAIHSDGSATNLKAENWRDAASELYNILQFSGSREPKPNMLFMDGVMVIERGAAHWGYDYCNKENAAMNAFLSDWRNDHMPEWAK